MEIFVEKSFSVIIKKILCSGEIVVYDEFIIFITVRQIEICVHLRLLFKL